MRNLLYIIIAVVLTGCIEPYNPSGANEISGQLVIEGTITDNESVFTLRTSVKLSERLTGKETVDDAFVYVEKDNGEQLQGVFTGNGTYTVATGDLDAGTKYRLYVKAVGEEYRSEFLSPLFTPEIDSISPLKKGEGEPVYICVNTHDPDDQSRYYLWSYNEIWEVKAELFANYGYLVPNSPQFFTTATAENTYYCWGRDNSKSMLLGLSDNLSENVISQKRLNEIPCYSDKISILYFISVKQNQIRKEAYDYYLNIQKNIELTGSIFAPIPSEMRGNILCVTNPEQYVIGYIDVSTTTEKERFFPESMGLYEAPGTICHRHITSDPALAYPIYGYYEYIPTNPLPPLYAPHECVDCRIKENASKDRPDFWPNNDY